MSHLVLPKLFNQSLNKAPSLRASLDVTIAHFDSWLKHSHLPFFPDYTDHGPDHIGEVLATSVELMTAKAKAIFSPQDAAVYVLAVLLDDASMHLTQAGFYTLIKGDAANQHIAGFDDVSQSWPNLWSQYLYSVRRWDERQMQNVFGEKAAASLGSTIHDPFDHYDNLQDTDYRLIGEFIRRYHPRMAHEFALYGVPGPTGERLHIHEGKDGFNSQLRDAAGLTARSHGMPFRNCLDYLKEKEFAKWQPNLHSVYLMTLLRIADYMQIQPGRAISPRFDYYL